MEPGTQERLLIVIPSVLHHGTKARPSAMVSVGIRSPWSFPTLHTSEETLFQIGLNCLMIPK